MSLSVWHEGWESRIQGFVSDAGYGTVRRLLEKYPGRSYNDVVAITGIDAAPIQLARMQMTEARKSHDERSAAQDSLVRFLQERLKSRPAHLSVEYERASAFVAWESLITDQGRNSAIEYIAKQVWSMVKNQCPPDVWIPSGADDPVIVRAFAAGWPDTKSV